MPFNFNKTLELKIGGRKSHIKNKLSLVTIPHPKDNIPLSYSLSGQKLRNTFHTHQDIRKDGEHTQIKDLKKLKEGNSSPRQLRAKTRMKWNLKTAKSERMFGNIKNDLIYNELTTEHRKLNHNYSRIIKTLMENSPDKKITLKTLLQELPNRHRLSKSSMKFYE